MLNRSYRHADEQSEGERLVDQFLKDWPWEKGTLARLGIHSGSETCRRALCYGCGIGIDAATLHQEGFAVEVEGWDSSDFFVAQASKRFATSGLVYKHADLVSSAVPDGTRAFDLIYLRLVLLHVPVPSVSNLLRNCLTILSDRGCLVVHDVNKDREKVLPSDHEFAVILKEIVEYLRRCGTNPSIGEAMPNVFAALGLTEIRSETVELQADLHDTCSDLAFAPNVMDESRAGKALISEQLWKAACTHHSPQFERRSYRVITVGKKIAGSATDR